MLKSARDAQRVVGAMLLEFSKNPRANIVSPEHMVRQHLVLIAVHRAQNAVPVHFQKLLAHFKSPQRVMRALLVLRKKITGKPFVCHAYPASTKIKLEKVPASTAKWANSPRAFKLKRVTYLMMDMLLVHQRRVKLPSLSVGVQIVQGRERTKCVVELQCVQLERSKKIILALPVLLARIPQLAVPLVKSARKVNLLDEVARPVAKHVKHQKGCLPQTKEV
jgi:hypothetical protein